MIRYLPFCVLHGIKKLYMFLYVIVEIFWVAFSLYLHLIYVGLCIHSQGSPRESFVREIWRGFFRVQSGDMENSWRGETQAAAGKDDFRNASGRQDLRNIETFLTGRNRQRMSAFMKTYVFSADGSVKNMRKV